MLRCFLLLGLFSSFFIFCETPKNEQFLRSFAQCNSLRLGDDLFKENALVYLKIDVLNNNAEIAEIKGLRNDKLDEVLLNTIKCLNMKGIESGEYELIYIVEEENKDVSNYSSLKLERENQIAQFAQQQEIRDDINYHITTFGRPIR